MGAMVGRDGRFRKSWASTAIGKSGYRADRGVLEVTLLRRVGKAGETQRPKKQR